MSLFPGIQHVQNDYDDWRAALSLLNSWITACVRVNMREEQQQSDPYRECLRVHAALYHLDAGGERLFIQLGVQQL